MQGLGLGFREVHPLRFRVQGSGFRVWGLGSRVQGLRFGIKFHGFGVSYSRSDARRVWGLESVLGWVLEFRV